MPSTVDRCTDARSTQSKGGIGRLRSYANKLRNRRRDSIPRRCSVSHARRDQRANSIMSAYEEVYATPLTREELKLQKKLRKREPVLEMVPANEELWGAY